MRFPWKPLEYLDYDLLSKPVEELTSADLELLNNVDLDGNPVAQYGLIEGDFDNE